MDAAVYGRGMDLGAATAKLERNVLLKPALDRHRKITVNPAVDGRTFDIRGVGGRN